MLEIFVVFVRVFQWIVVPRPPRLGQVGRGVGGSVWSPQSLLLLPVVPAPGPAAFTPLSLPPPAPGGLQRCRTSFLSFKHKMLTNISEHFTSKTFNENLPRYWFSLERIILVNKFLQELPSFASKLNSISGKDSASFLGDFLLLAFLGVLWEPKGVKNVSFIMLHLLFLSGPIFQPPTMAVPFPLSLSQILACLCLS